MNHHPMIRHYLRANAALVSLIVAVVAATVLVLLR